jgi:hypothetical protein
MPASLFLTTQYAKKFGRQTEYATFFQRFLPVGSIPWRDHHLQTRSAFPALPRSEELSRPVASAFANTSPLVGMAKIRVSIFDRYLTGT